VKAVEIIGRLFYLTGMCQQSILFRYLLHAERTGGAMPESKTMTVKDWPEDERPRERLLKYGADGLSDAQLLAIIIRNGRGGRSAVDLGMELLDKFKSLEGIAQAGIEEICGKDGVKGIGKAKAAEIKAAIEIGRRWYKMPSHVHEAPEAFCSSQDVVNHFKQTMKGLKKEVFHCVLLDTKNKALKVIRDEEVSKGSLTASIVHPRDTFKAAIRESAAAVIFIHNHPSGDTKPSQEDILLTRRLVQAGEVLGIQVLDHIIVGDGSHFSFRDNGMITRQP
jgi:DNA repair protein RadC